MSETPMTTKQALLAEFEAKFPMRIIAAAEGRDRTTDLEWLAAALDRVATETWIDALECFAHENRSPSDVLSEKFASVRDRVARETWGKALEVANKHYETHTVYEAAMGALEVKDAIAEAALRDGHDLSAPPAASN